MKLSKHMVLLILAVALLAGCQNLNQGDAETNYVNLYGYRDTLTVYINNNETVISVTPPSYYNFCYSYTIFDGRTYTTRTKDISDIPKTTNTNVLLIKYKQRKL